MSLLISAELVATCNSLGYYDAQTNKYYAYENTLEGVKDLIRYLKRDDESHDIRRHLGETNVVQTDLLPLLKNYWEQTDLFDVLLRLLVNLTTPALMLWNEEIPTDRKARNQYLQIEEHLRLYKQAFDDEAVWAVLSTRISKILEVDSGERLEETGLTVERILILIRNILHVPADVDAEKRPDNDASIHDQVLWALHQSGILDIILYVSSANEKAYYMHILEIMCYMLREQNAKELASAALQRSQDEKLRDEAALLAIRQKESNKRQQKARDFSGARHSRFRGTFVVKSMKSISDNELIYHKPLSKLDDLSFDLEKAKLKTPKNRVPIRNTHVERRSAFSIRLFLKEFCVEFLNGAYNTFMYVVRERLARQQAQKHDETYYLWALRFFLEFNRCYKFDIKLVSETMSVQAFQYVQRQLENYSEMMISDKKFILLWAKRLHTALLSYRELLSTLCVMDKSTDEAVRASSKVIKSNIFYVLEYRELILHLMILYNDVTMTPEYLQHLIETQHIFLKLFEAYCSGKSVMVEEKAKKRKKAKQARRKSKPPSVPMDVESLWSDISGKLKEYLEGTATIREEMNWKVTETINRCIPEGETPTSSSFTSLGVQKLIAAKEVEEAVALMLATRDKYPDMITSSEDVMEQLEEFYKIFFNIAEPGLVQEQAPEDESEPEEENNYADEEDDLQEEYQVHESDLKFEDFSRRLANPKIVRACALALNHFDENSVLTNHCIVKLLHRIAFDSKMPTMLFQVSIFRIFQRIYEEKSFRQHKELVTFATYIIRQFFVVAATNTHVYMEALFWKTPREACEIEEGYGSYQEKSQAMTRAWSEREEDELRRLFIEHQQNSIEKDVVDWIVDNLVDNTKTRRAVLKKLKEMYLLTDYKQKKSAKSSVPKEWSDDEVQQLRELFEQFKEAMDPLTCIMDRLEVHRPKNRIVEKLLELDLVQDKKELRKKRAKQSKSGANNPFQYAGNDIESEGESDDDSEDNSDDDNASSTSKQSITVRNTQHRRTTTSKAKSKKKSKPRTSISTKEISRMLIALAEGETNQGLDWLKESLEDVLEDLQNNPDDNSEEGVPLVPILDYSIAAMENPEFLVLLKALDVQEPSDEQESYWRIPAILSAHQLQVFIDLLSKALQKTLVLEDEEENSQDNALVQTATANDSGSEDDYVLQNLNKQKTVTSEDEIQNEVNFQIVETNEVEGEKKKTVVKSKKIQTMRDLIKKHATTKTQTNSELTITGLDNSDNDEDEMSESTPNKKKKRIRVESKSNDDDNEDSASQMSIGEDESNRMSFNPARIYDYDSDNAGNTMTTSATTQSQEVQEFFRSARVIIESDEDEDTPSMAITQLESPKETGDTMDDGIPLKSSKAKTNLLDDNENDGPSTSDKENANTKENNSNNESEESKRLRSISDSESERDKPKSKRSRVIMSSDDEDN